MSDAFNEGLSQGEINHRRTLRNQGIDIGPTQSRIIRDLLKERVRQDEKFGPSPRGLEAAVWLIVMMEELGEVARAILQGDSINYRDELVQLGACSVAALEDYYLGKQTMGLSDVGCGINYEMEMF